LQGLLDLPSRTDCHHQKGHICIASEEAGAPALAVHHAVDAEQDRRARDAAVLERLADGREGGRSMHTVVASQVDGELYGLIRNPRELRHVPVNAVQTGSLQRDQPFVADLADLFGELLDPRPGVDCDRDERKVFGESQQPVAASAVLGAKALHSTQQDTGSHCVARVDVEQLVGEQASLHTTSLTEIGGQLQCLLHYRPPPIHRPRAAALKPTIALTITLSVAPGSWPSSPRRWVSNIQVENVVYEPIVAVPTSTSASPERARPLSNPRTSAPLAFTARVPSGKPEEVREEADLSSRNRATEPMLPSSATPIHASVLTRRFPQARDWPTMRSRDRPHPAHGCR